MGIPEVYTAFRGSRLLPATGFAATRHRWQEPAPTRPQPRRGFVFSARGFSLGRGPLAAAILLITAPLAGMGCSSAAGVGAAPSPAPPAPTPTAAPIPTALPTPTGPYARILGREGRPVYVRLDVADTPQERSVGLSRRPSLPEDAGMVFLFESDQQAAFWMKDTLVPLSIAFISAEGRILEIQDMEPQTEDLHRPALPYRYALEVNQGFFARNGVGAGDRVEFHLGGRQ